MLSPSINAINYQHWYLDYLPNRHKVGTKVRHSHYSYSECSVCGKYYTHGGIIRHIMHKHPIEHAEAVARLWNTQLDYSI